MSYHVVAAHGARSQQPLHITLGELIAYDPTTHSGTFRLPADIDNLNQSTDSGPYQDTGFIPIGTLFTGPGYGMRFVPLVDATNGGSQALVVFSDHTLEHPIGAVFLFNQVEAPPFTDVHTQGWQDSAGNQIVTHDDTGLAEIVGNETGAIVAPNVGVGDLFANLGADNDVVTVAMLRSAVTAVFNAHTHPGVQTGSGTTAPPTAQMTPQGSSTVRAKN
jgi:hypothetical protein